MEMTAAKQSIEARRVQAENELAELAAIASEIVALEAGDLSPWFLWHAARAQRAIEELRPRLESGAAAVAAAEADVEALAREAEDEREAARLRMEGAEMVKQLAARQNGPDQMRAQMVRLAERHAALVRAAELAPTCRLSDFLDGQVAAAQEVVNELVNRRGRLANELAGLDVEAEAEHAARVASLAAGSDAADDDDGHAGRARRAAALRDAIGVVDGEIATARQRLRGAEAERDLVGEVVASVAHERILGRLLASGRCLQDWPGGVPVRPGRVGREDGDALAKLVNLVGAAAEAAASAREAVQDGREAQATGKATAVA